MTVPRGRCPGEAGAEVKQPLDESPGRPLPASLAEASSMGCGGPWAAEEVEHLDLLDEAS